MSPQTPRIGDRGPDVRMKAKPVVITFPADRRHTANSTTAHCRATEADQIAATGNSSFAKTDDCGEKTSAGVLHRPPKGRGGLGDLSRGDDIQRQAPQENTQAEKATPFRRNGSFYCVALEMDFKTGFKITLCCLLPPASPFGSPWSCCRPRGGAPCHLQREGWASPCPPWEEDP